MVASGAIGSAAVGLTPRPARCDIGISTVVSVPSSGRRCWCAVSSTRLSGKWASRCREDAGCRGRRAHKAAVERGVSGGAITAIWRPIIRVSEQDKPPSCLRDSAAPHPGSLVLPRQLCAGRMPRTVAGTAAVAIGSMFHTARPQASVWLTTFDCSQRLQAQAPIL